MKKSNYSILNKFFVLLVCGAFSLTLQNCSVDTSGNLPENELPDESVQLGDGGTTDPTENTTTGACPTNDSGDCVEPQDNQVPTVFSSQNIDFSLNPINFVECVDLPIPNGLSYVAEIDKTQTTCVTQPDADSDTCAYQFAFKTTSGAYSPERVSGSETLSICYLRDQISDNHSGFVKLVLSSQNTTGSYYAYVLKLTGQTTQKAFEIYSPKDIYTDTQGGSVFHGGSNEGSDLAEGDYYATLSGKYNIDELGSVLKDGLSTPILVNVEGVLVAATLASDGTFTRQISLPTTPGVYPIEISVETKKTVLRQEINVAVMAAPSGYASLQVRNHLGDEITSSSPSDATTLVGGVKISGIDFIAPNAKHPVKITDIKWNGQEVLAPDTSIFFDPDQSHCTDSEGKAYTGFDGLDTFCFPITAKSVQGVNTITATVENELGKTDISQKVILDYSVPNIVFTSPRHRELLPTGTTKVRIAGYVKNYLPDPSFYTDISSYAKVRAGEDGFWCQPTSTAEEDPQCPASPFKMWLNTSHLTPPIYIYPKALIAENHQNMRELNQSIGDQSGHCYQSATEETVYSPSEDATVTEDENGNTIIKDVVEADDGTKTTTVTTVNTTTGAITQTVGTTTTTLVAAATSENTTVTQQPTETGLSLLTDDANTDSKTNTTVDESGKITRTIDTKKCNIPHGVFAFDLETAGLNKGHTFPKLSLYYNSGQAQLESVAGHRKIQLLGFYTGKTKQHAHYPESGDLWTGDLGMVDDTTGLISQPPFALFASKNILENQDLKLVVQQLLNENLNFSDLAKLLPTHENDMEEDFREHYKKKTGNDYPGFLNLSTDWQQMQIYHLLHGSMVQKWTGLNRYRQYLVQQTGKDGGKYDANGMMQTFFRDPADYPDLDPTKKENFDVSANACGHRITTSFMPYGNVYDVFSTVMKEMNYSDADIEKMVTDWDMWPGVLAKKQDKDGNWVTDHHWEDVVQGKWIVDEITLKDGGFIDLDVCLVPKDAVTTGCAEEDFVDYGKQPAFMMHVASMNLVRHGLSEVENDPEHGVPLIWMVQKIRLNFKDVLRLHKVAETDAQGNRTGRFVNRLEINGFHEKFNDVVDESAISINHDNPYLSWDDNSVSLKNYPYCKEFYHDRYGERARAQGVTLKTPVGCGELPYSVDSLSPEAKNYDLGYAFVLEQNTPIGAQQAPSLTNYGDNDFLLGIVWNGVASVFRDIFSCADTEMVQPIFTGNYPEWAIDAQKMSLDLAIDDTDDGIELVSEGDAVNKFAMFSVNLLQSDLDISSAGITARVPLKMGVSGVHSLPKTSSAAPALATKETSPGDTVLDMSPQSLNFVPTAHSQGHLVRDFEPGNINKALDSLSSSQDNVMNLGASLHVEEIVNSLAYLIFKKDISDLLELADFDEIDVKENRVPLDAVIFSRFDACGDFMGVLKTTLPAGVFFSDFTTLFDTPSMHLDLIVSKDDPITLAMEPVYENGEVVENAVDIKLGINNLQLAAKNFYSCTSGSQTTYYYTKEQSLACHGEDRSHIENYDDIVRLQMNITLSLKVVYHPSEQVINIFIEDLSEQSLHIGVVKGEFDDVLLVTDLYDSLLQNVFTKLSSKFNSALNVTAEDGTKGEPVEASFSIKLNPDADGKISVASLNDLEVDAKMGDAPIGSCNDQELTYSGQNTTFSGNIGRVGESLKKVITRSDFLTQLKNTKNNANGLFRSTTAAKTGALVSEHTLPIDVSGADKIDSHDVFNDLMDYRPECLEFYQDNNKKDADGNSLDNPIREMFCEYGLADVSVTPDLSFENGYIHFSMDFWLTLEQWLVEESVGLDQQEGL